MNVPTLKFLSLCMILVALVNSCGSGTREESVSTIRQGVITNSGTCQVSTLTASATPTTITNAADTFSVPITAKITTRLQIISGDPSNFTATLVFSPSNQYLAAGTCYYSPSGTPPQLVGTYCSGASLGGYFNDIQSVALSLTRVGSGGAVTVQSRVDPSDDQNPCTLDTCSGGNIVHVAWDPGTSCSDGLVCNGLETCGSTANCLAGTAPPLDDGNPCTTDTACTEPNGVGHTAIAGCGVPPNAPPSNPNPQSVGDGATFLYTGANPIQTGVSVGVIDPTHTAVIRGRVLNAAGGTLQGATITIVGHPEFGSTQSRSDGWFDFAVNGGGLLAVQYQLTNYLPVQRQAMTYWQDYTVLADAVMIAKDAQVTTVTSGSGTYQVASGTTQQDGDGNRTARVFFPAGTTTTNFTPPNGTLGVRATEFTVGTNGRKAMPGDLPANSAYTYAVELSIDEADPTATVNFSQAVNVYLDNFA